MVTLSITGGPTISVPYVNGMNGQNLLEAAYDQLGNSQQFTFALQFYGQNLGYLVVMINETYDTFLSTGQPFFYWEFLINGVPSPVGIDQAQLQDGDVVTFSFESYASSTHAESTLHAKHAFKMR